jgi:CheY-like chemotaxis protein
MTVAVAWSPPVARSQPLDGVRVLLVDDDPSAREALAPMLEDDGATVVVVGSGVEALEMLERVRPDVLVSDIAMPDMDGYVLIRTVRAREPERGGRVSAVALTGYASAEDRARALAAGFDAHVAKPFGVTELVGVVADLIRDRAA